MMSRRTSHLRWSWCACAALVGLLASGCTETLTDPAPAIGPAADLSEELAGGNGVFLGEAASPNLGAVGYVQHEYVAAGTASSYEAVGEQSGDGFWTFVVNGSAQYRTRILVRRPADADDFNGTVVVEWLNVSGGVDAGPDWTSLEEELVRRGYAWVGVSAQLIGIEGGPVLVAAPGAEALAGKGLKGIDPARYGSLAHPGDGFSFDIFTQVANALRAGAPPLDNLRPRRMIAAGESQSAIALTTYYNGVQPLTGAFDGFFVHSRAFAALPLVGPGEYADLVAGLRTSPVIFRTDLDAPILDLQSEGDVTSILGSVLARQPDSDKFRLWEVAGTAHADVHLIGFIADMIDCGVPINDGPLHFVAKAALRALDLWVRTGEVPPAAPRLEIASDNPPTIARDADGIALGGIRTPLVDAPVDVLSGVPGPSPAIICLLLGSTTPLSNDRLAELYDSPADYEQQYMTDAVEAIGAGFVLDDDRTALLAYSDPSRIPD
jgi:hypothetical protein